MAELDRHYGYFPKGMLRGGILSESDNSISTARPEMVGRVLYERFLVERDLTDQSIGGGLSAYEVKDLKNFCRDVTFKTLTVQPHAIVGGPTFQHVCQALARLGHRNIEEVLETGLLFDGRPYAVTLLPNGHSLAEVVRVDGRLELSRVASIIEQIAEALEAAHSARILHCDVRPSNVIVSDGGVGRGQTYLINFGAAWPVDGRGATLENVQPGSEPLSYAAPELHAKLGHRSTASDIFSLAAVAYRLIVGRVPFAGEDRVSLLRAINAGHMLRPTECRTDLSHDAEGLILAGLQFEPAWRPQNVGDFGVRLALSLRHATRPLALPSPRPAGTQPPHQPAELFAHTDEKIEDAAAPHGDHNLSGPTPKEAKSSPTVSERAVAWALIILLIAGALSIPIGQTLMAEEGAVPATSAMLPRSRDDGGKVRLRYWFEDLLPEGGNGETGSEELVIATSAAGKLFVIGEKGNPQGGTSYRSIFPIGNTGVVGAEKTLRVGTGPGGDERLWIVWTPADQGNPAGLPKVGGGQAVVPDDEAGKLRHFLERSRNLRVVVSTDASTGHTILDGSGERLVHRIEPNRK